MNREMLRSTAGWKLADDGKRYKGKEKMDRLRILVYDEPAFTDFLKFALLSLIISSRESTQAL